MASLAAVVQGYLTMAEKKTEAAKQEAIDKVGSANRCLGSVVLNPGFKFIQLISSHILTHVSTGSSEGDKS